MSEWVSYQGKPLGRIKLNDNNTNKFVYIAEGLDSLVALFQLKPDDVVETEDRGEIRFEEFKRDCLSGISGFYPNMDAWLLKNERAKTIGEQEKNRKPE
jgi:hypothetical protein